MQLFIQIIFAVAVLIGGYQCAPTATKSPNLESVFEGFKTSIEHVKKSLNLCGRGKKAELLPIPKVDKIFKTFSVYAMNPDKLVDEFNTYKSSIDGVKKPLEALNDDKRASQISGLIDSDLLQFDIWTNDIVKLNKENQNYASRIAAINKKMIVNNMQIIESFNYTMMTKLENILQTDEKAATKQRDDLEKVATSIRYEMAKHKIHVDEISENLKKGVALQNIFDGVKSAFSLETEKMKEISDHIKSCDAVKNRLMKKIEKLLKSRFFCN
ncbi:uncharacterized protein LOC116341192 [Contarinia nasturtii]|uniref:uncharacterized protein LOC116341192 n=1 Tax=Contarinia nasturtii TaxID=265458 RepID=UPI0012D451AA|nr:uncharacterized protein LOC116341192 [Contarinia nasturtii]